MYALVSSFDFDGITLILKIKMINLFKLKENSYTYVAYNELKRLYNIKF